MSESAAPGRILLKTKLEGIPAIRGESVAIRRNWMRLSIARPKKPSISLFTIHG